MFARQFLPFPEVIRVSSSKTRKTRSSLALIRSTSSYQNNTWKLQVFFLQLGDDRTPWAKILAQLTLITQ